MDSPDAGSADTDDGVVPVVVVGAGLGGSAISAFLAAHGIVATTLERRERANPRPRAWIMSARTAELFRGLGLEESIRDLGTAGSWDLQLVSTLSEAPDGHAVLDKAAEVSPTGSMMCDQDIQEDLFRRYAIDRGADIRWGETVTGLEASDGSVTVQRSRGPALRARFVVIADGARADLLDSLGITVSEPLDTPFDEFDQLLFRSRQLDELMRDRPGKAFVTAADTIVFRRDLGRWQIQRQAGYLGDDLAAVVAQTVGHAIDFDVLDHSTWRPSARRANSYRTGNVFVIGDAAHAMPPSLGMAGNLAIADAHNLAWKLAWVLTGRSATGLLDSYEAERKPVDELVLDQSLARMRGEPTISTVTLALGVGYAPASSAALLGDDDDITVTDPRYTSSPVVGARLPHVSLPDGRSSLDLVAPDTFIAVGPSHQTTSVPYYRVPEFGATPEDNRVWLVRPDGHVAALTEDANEVDSVVARLLTRPAESS